MTDNNYDIRAEGKSVGHLRFPPEWFGGETWMYTEVVLSLQEDATGEYMFVAGGVLTDGTNLIGLCWRGGQALACSGPANHWGLEERTDPGAPQAARETWATVVKCLVKGHREYDAAMGRPPV